MHRWKLINDALGLGKPEPEETYSTSEHLFTQLDIPREATGTLPRAMRGRVGLEAEAVEDIGETGKVRSPRRGRGGAESQGRSGSGRNGSGRGGSERGGSGRSGSGRSGGQDRGGSAGRSAAATPGEAGDGTGEVTRTRRRRRTRAGREATASAEGQTAENQPEEGRRKAS